MSNLRRNDQLTNYTCVSITSLQDDNARCYPNKTGDFVGRWKERDNGVGALNLLLDLARIVRMQGNTHVARMQLTRASAGLSFAAIFFPVKSGN